MCGIVGVIGFAGLTAPDPVAKALIALGPRGPDGGGRESGRLGVHRAVVAARRLALVDPSGGKQPFTRPSGSLLVVNGEIYNHDALRMELESKGESFRTKSDGEVLAALLDREGPQGLTRVEGSYAFAWLAPDGESMCIGRDPAGVRPLVFARTAAGLVFASTVDGVLATGLLPRRANLEAVADVLRDGVVAGGRTAIQGIERVLPGHVLRFDRDLVPTRVEIAPPDGVEGAAGGSVLDALRSAVMDRMRLDRPIGVFLSGGIDSAIVAALASEQLRLPAFTLTFPGLGEWDEGPRAARTALKLSLPHVEVPCPEDASSWVMGAANAFDEPFADSSAVPTWGLAKAAGVTVRAALTGTGGDEVFGGYRRYWLLGTGPWLRSMPVAVRSPVATALARVAPSGARLLRASTDPQGLYRGLMRLQTVEDAIAISGPLIRTLTGIAPAEGPATPQEAMAEDSERYLPDDLLVKEDRALMAHGVEGRHPFLDRRVRAAASRMEVRGGVGRGRQKDVLRAYVRQVIDPDLSRVSKHGFAFPVDALYADRLRPFSEEVLCERRARERGFTDPDAVRRLLRDHATGRRAGGTVIHALVMLELWAKRVLDRHAS